MNDTDSRYASLAYYYVQDRAGLAQTDAVAFSGPGVEMMKNFFEGDDDDVPVKCAILKTNDPAERVLKIYQADAGVWLRSVLKQAINTQRVEIIVDSPLAHGAIRTGTHGSASPRATSSCRRPW